MKTVHQLAQSLFGVAAIAASPDCAEEPLGDGEWRSLPEIACDELLISANAAQLIADLDRALGDADWIAPGHLNENIPGVHWTFGTARKIYGPLRKIRGGFLEPVYRVPLVKRVPDRVALYLISLGDGENYLDRENHGASMGWHYHYLDQKKRRTDAMLSWDTRWVDAGRPTPAAGAKRGLFVEKHGDARVRAHPGRWGPRKCKTMYDACAPDLSRWDIREFRCASTGSEAVHPFGAVVTPH